MPWPRTLWRSLVLAAVVYVLFQPAMLWLLHVVFAERPLPTGWPEWRAFLMTVAVLGAVAGGVTYYAPRLAPGWRRAWLGNVTWMLAFFCMLAAREFAAANALMWAVNLVLATLLAAAVWTILMRLLARLLSKGEAA